MAEANLLRNEAHKKWVEAYAQDNDLFLTNYAKAHVALSELGQESILLGEMDEANIRDGGYVEPNRFAGLA